MKIEVALDRSLREAEGQSHLARIVASIGDGWHEWTGPDPDEAAFDPYFEQYRPHREFLRKSYTHALLYPLESTRTIVVVEPNSESPAVGKLGEVTCVALPAAAALVSEPLSVLVENESNDGAFYLRLVEIVDDELVGMFHETRPRIRFENGGGKTVVAALVRERARLALRRGVPVRVLVVADSDSRFPGHDERDTLALQQICEEVGAPLFVLQKRAIENYVTDRVLAEYASENVDLQPAIAFILALPPKARDHYPMKKGIPASGGRPSLPDGPERALYDGVEFPDDTRPRVPRLAERFASTRIVHTEQDLIDRCCLDEVRSLAGWLRGEL